MDSSTETGAVAVIFTNQLEPGLDDDAIAAYHETADAMVALASAQPGFLGIESVRGPDGIGITVSYWRTDAHARAWKQQREHIAAQRDGRAQWYAWYRLRVATIERSYTKDRGLIFHLALPDDWEAAQRRADYRISTRGRTLDEEGFIHCSLPAQIQPVASRFYADVDRLVVLHVDPAAVGADVRYEPPAPGADELFPHVYGPIPLPAVIATTDWVRGPDGWGMPELVT